MKSFFGIVVIFFTFLNIHPSQASAEVVRVTYLESYEERVVDLKPGQKADVIAYLAGAGQPVENFQVLLTVLGHKDRIVASDKSDQNGIAKFHGIEPGNYVVLVKQSNTVDEDEHAYIQVGDVTVKAIGDAH